MPEIKVVNMAGAEVGTMTLSDAVFAADVKGAVPGAKDGIVFIGDSVKA